MTHTLLMTETKNHTPDLLKSRQHFARATPLLKASVLELAGPKATVVDLLDLLACAMNR